MQYQTMPFGWSMPLYLPLPPTIDDRDLFINSVVNGGLGTPGPAGPAGPQGEAGVGVVSAEVTDNPGDLLLLLTDGTIINAGPVIGPPGPSNCCGCSTITITEDYCATETDCYIGAQLKEKATVTLPNTAADGTKYTIKLEFGAPVGNRKLIVQPESPALINGVTAITMTTPYESLNVIYNNGNWWTT
jgi:hypothetical protein